MKTATVVSALLCAVVALSGCAYFQGGSWMTLIDGDKGLENWYQVGDANWRAEDGAIVADRGKGGFLLSKYQWGDFEARVEFWAADNANSGIYMRCSDVNKVTDRTCHEANIFDQRPDQTFATGGIVHLGKVLQPVKAGGKWNLYEITARGRHIAVVLNGVKTAEIDNAEHLEGPLGLQYGTLPPNAAPGGAIKFRKVQVRPL